MRVTQSMYYENMYANRNDSLQSSLFDVNKQIASGLKIQYAKDDVVPSFSESSTEASTIEPRRGMLTVWP